MLSPYRILGAVATLFTIGFLFFTAPPLGLTLDTVVTIAPGASAAEVASSLAAARVIAHPLALRVALRLVGSHTGIQSGSYLFKTPANLITIASRLERGEFGLPLAKITFPEGITVREAAARVAAALPATSATDFISLAKKDEGYLFPDTYFFPVSSTAQTIVATMRANFDTKTKPLLPDIAASGHSLSDVVIIASLVEKEARSVANKKLVAGVLWNRLELDMPLQVDAVFGYIFNRDTYAPSPTDLKVESPYNTYLHKGLPPGPINNPGLDSINAALHPTPTDYLFYLTGSDNLMHYARTYPEHQSNLKKYLK